MKSYKFKLKKQYQEAFASGKTRQEYKSWLEDRVHELEEELKNIKWWNFG